MVTSVLSNHFHKLHNCTPQECIVVKFYGISFYMIAKSNAEETFSRNKTNKILQDYRLVIWQNIVYKSSWTISIEDCSN